MCGPCSALCSGAIQQTASGLGQPSLTLGIHLLTVALVGFSFLLQPNKAKVEMKELRLLCAEDDQIRSCWMTAFRLLKVCASSWPQTQNLPASAFLVFGVELILH